MKREKCTLKSNEFNFRRLVFYGNKDQKPGWCNMGNLSNVKANELIPEFQTFLLGKKLVPEKNVMILYERSA
jgi:hypothetical protein